MNANASIMALALACLLGAGRAHAGTLGVFTSGQEGRGTQSFYYDDGREVVLVDTPAGAALTRQMVERVKSLTRSPVTRVVVTQPDPGQYGGLPYLHGLGIRSISSGPVASAMRAAVNAAAPHAYPGFQPVQERFFVRQRLHLASGETLTLFGLKHGATGHRVVVRVDATGDLVVGDLVQPRAHAGHDTDDWLAALDELPPLAKGHPDARVYGGRGAFVPVAHAVQAQKAHLLKTRSIAVAGQSR